MDSQLTIVAPPVEAEAEAVPAVSLAARVEHINTLAAQVAIAEERARQAGAQAWQLGLMLGFALCKLKAELPHGEFKKLFKNNSKSCTCATFGFSYHIGNRHMNLYREAERWCKRRSLSMCGGVLPAEAEVPAELSMRGAMQLFREDAEGNDLRPAPKFASPNTAGRIRKGGEEVSEQELQARRAEENGRTLRNILHELHEFIRTGRHLEMPPGLRDEALRELRDARTTLLALRD